MTMIEPSPVFFGNMGPVAGYRVTASEESAPLYAILAGCFITLAILMVGYRIVWQSRYPRKATRLTIIVVAGCLSIGWFALWIWKHAGNDSLIPNEGIWNFAVQLPTMWFWSFCILLVIGVVRLFVWFVASIERIGENKTETKDPILIP